MQIMLFFSEAYFQWGIISEDLDDNKFSDLAISTNSDCLVTFDKHFNVFTNIDFPKLTICSPRVFLNYF